MERDFYCLCLPNCCTAKLLQPKEYLEIVHVKQFPEGSKVSTLEDPEAAFVKQCHCKKIDQKLSIVTRFHMSIEPLTAVFNQTNFHVLRKMVINE